MSESLRDLVVSLSLNTDNFTKNIKSVNKQIQEAESYFKKALEALDVRYREDRLNAAMEYAQTMASVITPIWEQENIQQAAADVTELTRILRQYTLCLRNIVNFVLDANFYTHET